MGLALWFFSWFGIQYAFLLSFTYGLPYRPKVFLTHLSELAVAVAAFSSVGFFPPVQADLSVSFLCAAAALWVHSVRNHWASQEPDFDLAAAGSSLSIIVAASVSALPGIALVGLVGLFIVLLAFACRRPWRSRLAA